ncbi:WD40-repeat-containing domain protein [Thamnocephalis sphaerospora]|uniref:WD40-repeat-containing domain protein n=1 Tax=Thamnocephalis sphaerospora TaxID=78915 RepID=A0A4P9XMS4_9FUNG|nr:WD40-repeat-containing domain protein [Thamnocephalis sphaerospora]|eukprot:RKP07218.1 WD40-repeat-containing domain protein [Thamnocephalis sphaerospora]
MISALAWVRKGAAKELPDKYELTEEEFQRVSEMANERIRAPDEGVDAEMAIDDEAGTAKNGNAAAPEAAIDPELAEYDLEHYDDPAPGEEEEEEDEEDGGMSLFSKIKGLSYHASNEDDPYIVMNENDADSDVEDVHVRANDNMLVAAKTEDDISHLEVYVFEEAEDNLYVHHDVMLPSFPLCLEWLDFRAGRRAQEGGQGNYIAVGTFEPEIEIWDLDTMDAMYPDAILGAEAKKDKKAKKKRGKFHTDAVMSLAWNKTHRNILASASADTTVKLWDLNTLKCAHSFEHHTDKASDNEVQVVTWHPVEATVMATGSYDQTVTAFDSRAPGNLTRWSVPADVESLVWDVHAPQQFYVSAENGAVYCFDVRQGSSSTPVFTLQAHDDACSSVDIHPTIPGCLVTSSVDKTVKIWDLHSGKPSMLSSRDVGVGKVFSAKFCPDSKLHLAVCGTAGSVRIWDATTGGALRRALADRVTFPEPEGGFKDVCICG